MENAYVNDMLSNKFQTGRWNWGMDIQEGGDVFMIKTLVKSILLMVLTLLQHLIDMGIIIQSSSPKRDIL